MNLLGFLSPFDSQHKLVTSPLFSPWVLAIIRGLIALYTTTTLIVCLVSDGKAGEANQFFSFFTSLTYTGICSYFWASSIQTFMYANTPKRYPLQSWPKFLQVLHVMLQTTILTFPILVTAVFWALLASPHTLATPMLLWRNVSVHALNTVFCLFEMLLTNNPPLNWLFLWSNILILGGYVGVAYVTHATQGFYTYPFLDPEKEGPKLAIYIVGIALASVIIFIVVWGVMSLRQRFFRRRLEKDQYGEQDLEKMVGKLST